MAHKGVRNPARRGHELDPKPGESEAVQAWKERFFPFSSDPRSSVSLQGCYLAKNGQPKT
jgi:hypothetical protein